MNNSDKKLSPKDVAEEIKSIAKKIGKHPMDISKTDYLHNGGKCTEWQLRILGGFAGIKNTFFSLHDNRDYGVITDLSEIRREYSKLKNHLGNQQLFLEKLKSHILDIPKVSVSPYKPKKRKSKDEERYLNLNLSDLHIGSDILKEETGHAFGKVEEARAIAKIVENVVNYKTEYRDFTTLAVNIHGDIIENELHERTSADLIHMQTCRAMYLLSQAIAIFSANFKKVIVNFAVGNHGRDVGINKTRAVANKFNAIETTIYYGIRLACSKLKNVEFNQPYTPWATYEIFGKKVYVTHGDTNLSPGNIGSKIDTRNLENQINKINAALKDADEYSVFIVGHVHTPTVLQLSNGAFLIVNGSITPPNSFAQSMNIMESQQIQIMFESTQKYVVGDIRFINVSGSSDEKHLDKIIKPFKSLKDSI